MASTLLRTSVLWTAIALLVCGLPATATTSEGTRSITTEGECVLVDWTVSPETVIPWTGCLFNATSDTPDPCVYVDWTNMPPSVTPATNCP